MDLNHLYVHTVCTHTHTHTHTSSSSVASSSSSNNIQDQCLIITDIYGVRDKGVWLKIKNLIPNPNTVTVA